MFPMVNLLPKAALNPGYPKHGRSDHPMDDDISKISDEPVDSSGCYVVFTTVETRRNLQGLDPVVASSTCGEDWLDPFKDDDPELRWAKGGRFFLVSKMYIFFCCLT